MKSFIENYTDIIEESYPRWDIPSRDLEHFKSLYELSDIIDNILIPEIRKQEGAVSGPVLVSSAIRTKETLSTGSMSSVFASDLEQALTTELTAKWITPWTTMKAAANAAATPPPYLQMPKVKSDISSLFAPLIFSHYNGFNLIEVLINALDRSVTDAFLKYNKTQSKPYMYI